MTQRTRAQNVFRISAVVFSAPGFFLFGLLGGAITSLSCAYVADRLALSSRTTFEKEGYLASCFVGACISWASLFAGMLAVAAFGFLALIALGEVEWPRKLWLIGPFARPEGALVGLVMVSLPSIMLGAILGLFAHSGAPDAVP